MDQRVTYKGYSIRIFGEPFNRGWTAEMRKLDGSKIGIFGPPEHLRWCLRTSSPALTATAAFDLARQAIDGPGME
jgi:hypothetical protein